MDLSILDYSGYREYGWICNIKCKNFDEHGHPIYHLSLLNHPQYTIYYNVDMKEWYATCSPEHLMTFPVLKTPKRFHPVPVVEEDEDMLKNQCVQQFVAWSEAYSSKVVPYNRSNYKKARNRTIWLLKDISMIILVMANRSGISLPGEILESILSFLNIIIR